MKASETCSSRPPGFLPRDFSKILSAEPVLGEVFYLLSDEQLPAEYRENMRQVLHLLAEQARIALQPAMTGRDFRRCLARVAELVPGSVSTIAPPQRSTSEPVVFRPALERLSARTLDLLAPASRGSRHQPR